MNVAIINLKDVVIHFKKVLVLRRRRRRRRRRRHSSPFLGIRGRSRHSFLSFLIVLEIEE